MINETAGKSVGQVIRTTSAPPVLSIIIVSWNTRDLLRDCLRSVYENSNDLLIEVFVVDNASSDGSAAMVAGEFPQVHLIQNADNRGFAAANNQAIHLSAGRYVLLLNSDTLVLRDVLRRSVAYMEATPSVGAMGCRVLNADRTVQMTCFRYPSILNLILKISGLHRLSWPAFCGREHMRDWRRDTERDVEVITGCYLLVRGSTIADLGCLDEDFYFYGEDAEWCHRIREAGWYVRFAPVGEIIHFSGQSTSQLSYRRDVLLTRGVLLYLAKKRTIGAARVAWVLTYLFVATRALLWSAVSLFARRAEWLSRRKHFLELLHAFGGLYPKPTWHRASSAGSGMSAAHQ